VLKEFEPRRLQGKTFLFWQNCGVRVEIRGGFDGAIVTPDEGEKHVVSGPSSTAASFS